MVLGEEAGCAAVVDSVGNGNMKETTSDCVFGRTGGGRTGMGRGVERRASARVYSPLVRLLVVLDSGGRRTRRRPSGP